MPHIPLLKDLFGIQSLMAFRPETAKPINELADVMLRQPISLTSAERELIATFVSSENDCHDCQSLHGAIAAHLLGGNVELVRQVKRDPQSAPISGKLKALLVIAGKVTIGGKQVTSAHVEQARAQGATEMEIHDTVLIAATFCMLNRYVDGLATIASDDPEFYRTAAAQICKDGYVQGNRALQAAIGK